MWGSQIRCMGYPPPVQKTSIITSSSFQVYCASCRSLRSLFQLLLSYIMLLVATQSVWVKALASTGCRYVFTCTNNMILHVFVSAAVCFRFRMPLIMMMLTSTLPLLVSELSPDTNFLVGSQTQICLCSCTVTLSSLVTFIQCDTETSVTSTTVSFIPLGNE